jgi:hypothetical protein
MHKEFPGFFTHGNESFRLTYMTKRLQVLLEDSDFAALQQSAAARGLSVAEWVRQAIVAARRRESSADIDRKLDAIRTAVRHTGPTGPIERLTTDIERGYAAAGDPGY